MSRKSSIKEICDYLKESQTLTHLDLSENVLQSEDSKLILQSICIHKIVSLNLSDNMLGKEAAKILIDRVLVGNSSL